MSRKLSTRALSLLSASALACAPPAAHTQTAATPAAQSEEVVRVNSALVQTDVTVLDKDGRFVERLKPGEIELLVDGKPRPVSFFEAVKAGAPDEEAQLAAARGPRAAAARPLDRGRIFLFLVDDLHISPSNLQRTRETLTRFIDERPELSVRLRRGVAAGAVEKADDGREKKGKQKGKKDGIEEGLLAALKSLYPRQTLPTSVAAGFSDTPGTGPTLTISIEVDPQALGLEGANDPVALDVVGTVVNEGGKSVSDFEQNLTVTQLERGAARLRVIYNQQMPVKPGLYQVRVAARERKGGTAGSAYQWVEVPDIGKGGSH